MSDPHRLAAGVICTGFEGTSLDSDFEARLRDLPFAGLIVFGRNVSSPSQTRELTGQIRNVLAEPLIAIDQEGGRVARIRDGVEEIPSAMAIAATGDPALAEAAGKQMGFDLRRIGVNLDFAPVLDLALFAENTVIGTRSFGDDPERVAQLAGSFARGLRSAGIIPTYKHFPGHGSTAVDSHTDLPVIDLDEATLRSRDLLPFARLLPEAEAVMTAHIAVRALDERPATISHRILTGLLRDELRFAGVCFTDCLQMDAIAKSVGVEEGAVAALAAGADCLLLSHDLALALEAVNAIVRAVSEGRLSRERLEEAHARVSRLRRMLQGPVALDEAPPHPGIGREIGRRAVTVLRGEPRVNPRDCVVISFESTTTEGVVGTHSHHASLTSFAAVPEIRLPLDPLVLRQAQDDMGTMAQGKQPIILVRRAHIYRSQAAAVHRILREHPEAVVVSTREPFDAFEFPEAKNLLCTYGDDAPSLAGLAEVLFQGAQAEGKYPLHGGAVART